jgi:hypothetical protein
MKKIFLIIAFNLTIYISNAQIIFEKTFGTNNHEKGISMQQTATEGYVIAGNTDNSGTADFFVVMTKFNGDTLWAKTYGSSGDDFLTSIKPLAAGGYILSGYSNGIAGNGYDVILARIGEDGNLIWSKSYGGTGDDKATDVIQNTNMQFVVTGSTNSFGAGNLDVYLLATDCTGNFLWSNSFGGPSEDFGNSIASTSDSGYFITGSTKSFGTNTDAYLIKTDNTGNKIWTKAIGGNNTDYANSGIQTSDGGFVFTGISYSWGTGTGDMYVVKMDSLGQVFWTEITGGADEDRGNSIIESNDGNYVIAGETNSYTFTSDLYLVKLSSSGDNIWSRVFGGPGIETGKNIIQTADGGYAIAGSTSNAGSGLDLYLVKTDESGKTSCVNPPFGVTALETIPVSATTDPSDSVTAVIPAINSGLSSIVNIVLALETKCYEDPAMITAVMAPTGPMTVAFSDTTETGEDPELIRNSAISENSLTEAAPDYSFTLFPNPSDGNVFNIVLKAEKDKEILVVVYDAIGKEHFSTVVITSGDSESLFAIDPMGKLSPGIYMVKATSDNDAFSRRLIVK